MTRARPIIVTLAFVLVLLGPLAAARAGEPAWEEIYTEDEIKVSRMLIEGSPLVAFKGDVEIDAPVQKVLWVLLDNSRREEWVDRLYESEVLEELSEHEYYLYQAFELPIFISNRDYVYHGKAVRDAETGVVTLKMWSEEHAKAPETVGVRAHLTNSAYIITPMGENKCRLEVEIQTDPKGWIPSWVVNMIQESWPYKTLAAIREQVKKDHVKMYPLPPVEEPAEPKKVVGGG